MRHHLQAKLIRTIHPADARALLAEYRADGTAIGYDAAAHGYSDTRDWIVALRAIAWGPEPRAVH